MSDETQPQPPTAASAEYPPAGPPAQPSNGLAIAALITGLAALLVCLIPFVNIVSVLAGLAGVVLGVLGLRAARQRQGAGRGMSIAGLITGAIAVVVAGIVLTLTVQTMMRVAEQTSDLTRLVQDLERLGETGELPDITGLPGLEDLEGIEGMEGLEGLGLDDLARSLEDLALPGLTAPEPTTVVAPGEPVTDGDLEFTVTGHQSASTIGDGDMPEQAGGEYVLVDVTVRNTGAAATMFVGTLQMLVDDQGTTHMVDLQTLVGTPDPTLAGTLAGSIEPGETVEGTLVYDLPTGAAPARLVLTGTMLSTAVAVDLG